MNDTQGHAQGDVLLRVVADGIRSLATDRIHGYRYGGDEFLVVACDGAESELEGLIGQWEASMGELASESGIAVTAAVGTAWSEAPFSLNDLIRQADQEMYANKHRDRNDTR